MCPPTPISFGHWQSQNLEEAGSRVLGSGEYTRYELPGRPVPLLKWENSWERRREVKGESAAGGVKAPQVHVRLAECQSHDSWGASWGVGRSLTDFYHDVAFVSMEMSRLNLVGRRAVPLLPCYLRDVQSLIWLGNLHCPPPTKKQLFDCFFDTTINCRKKEFA